MSHRKKSDLNFDLKKMLRIEAHYFFTGRTEYGRDKLIVHQEGCTQGYCCEGHKVNPCTMG